MPFDCRNSRIPAEKLAERVFTPESLINQTLQIAVIIYATFNFDLSLAASKWYDAMQKWPYFDLAIVYLLIYVIIWDPTAVFIKMLFLYITSDGANSEEDNDPRIGRMIGKLERTIIVSLVLFDQLGAIGFVLAAKSIARFRQLEDKNFSEKYLVGTLTSTCISFLVTVLLRALPSL